MEDITRLNKDLLCAARSSSVNEIRKYLDLGANVNCTDKDKGETPLHKACFNAKKDQVKFLLDRGCNPNLQSNLGNTPLHEACRSNKKADTVQILLEWGCNPNHLNKKGKTALHKAAEDATTDIIKVLIEYGCQPDQTDNLGKTSLHYAVENFDNTEMLLWYGFKTDQKDNEGRTALHVASSKTVVNTDVIRLLLESGFSPDEKDKKGKTPLDLFEQNEKFRYRTIDDKIETRQLLREYGEHWKTGLPIEVKSFDKKSAKRFASLLVEEGYNHYEARVMLAGEQGTGKTTIARYLVGKGPTGIRISTDGIDLYNGLSFIDRETEEWLHGKQDDLYLQYITVMSFTSDLKISQISLEYLVFLSGNHHGCGSSLYKKYVNYIEGTNF